VSSEALVATHALQGGYGHKHVVYDVDLAVSAGEIVALLGHNGAGKTTTLKTIFGMLPALGGRVTFDGEDATAGNCRRNVRRGMAMIPAERFVFADLTVRENLLLGATHARSTPLRDARYARIAGLFPVLSERPMQRAGTLSGGQQRMLSLGIALMSSPRLLLLDEPSLGLAPALVTTLFDAIVALAKGEGLGVLLLEQNVGQALRIADRVAVMRSGRVILEESAAAMRARETYWELF